MTQCKNGDYLIYCDAGVEIINNIRFITDRMKEPLWFFGTHNKNKAWCKADVFKAVFPFESDEEAREAEQVVATCFFMKVCEFTRQFVEDWLFFCELDELIDDSESNTPNDDAFIEHRHDQAILSLLAFKFGFHPHWFPAQYGNYVKGDYFPRPDYPVLFNHHRRRND